MGDQWLGHAPCLTLNRPTMRSSSVDPSSSSPVLPRNRLKVCSQSSKLSNSDSSSLGYTWAGWAVRPHASILPPLLPPPSGQGLLPDPHFKFIDLGFLPLRSLRSLARARALVFLLFLLLCSSGFLLALHWPLQAWPKVEKEALVNLGQCRAGRPQQEGLCPTPRSTPFSYLTLESQCIPGGGADSGLCLTGAQTVVCS